MVTIKYITHACFEISNKKKILIDPYFKENPTMPTYNGKPDIILITHEHFDHVDAGGFNSTVIAPSTVNFKNQITMKIGDEKEIDGIKIKMIKASHHQSKNPTGYVITIDGKKIAHLGDTYIDGVSYLGDIDLLLLPIGGYYTMNINEALKALEIIKPKKAIPMHYNTFDEIKADPEIFRRNAVKIGYDVVVLKPQETINL